MEVSNLATSPTKRATVRYQQLYNIYNFKMLKLASVVWRAEHEIYSFFAFCLSWEYSVDHKSMVSNQVSIMTTLISDLISRNSTVTARSLRSMRPPNLIEDFALTQSLLDQVRSEILHFEALKWA